MTGNSGEQSLILKNRYRLDRKIGEGGFGITYLSFDLQMQEHVVVKELKETPHNAYIHCIQQMMRQGKIPGLVQIKDMVIEGTMYYIVMEYLKGINGVEYLQQNGPMSQSQMAAVMRPILAALQYLHQHGLIHRDVSTDNLVIDQQGRGTLIDLGSISPIADAKDVEIKGIKQGFAPTELYFKHGNVGPWTDVYEVSATMYHLLTGEVPAPAPKRAKGFHMASLAEKKVSVSPALAEVMERGLMVEDQVRLRDVSAIRQILDEMPDDQTPVMSFQERKAPYVADESMTTWNGKKTVSEPAAGKKVSKEKKKKKWTALAIAAVMLVILGGCIAVYARMNHKNEEDISAKDTKYTQAVTVLNDHQDADAMREAVQTLEDLGDYKDSFKYLSQTADSYCEYSQYRGEAVDIYKYLSDAKYEGAVQSLFDTAELYFNDEDYNEAKKLYEYLGTSTDANGMSAEEGIEYCNYQLARICARDRDASRYSDTVEDMLKENKDYDSLEIMAAAYYDNRQYENAKAIYIYLAENTNGSYQNKIHECAARQSIADKYAAYDVENSEIYDSNAGTKVKYVEYDTAEEWMANHIYGSYSTEAGQTKEITSTELNGKMYGVKFISIDNRDHVKITATLYALNDEKQTDISMVYEEDVDYTFTDESGKSYDSTADILIIDGQKYLKN